ncbi:MAG: hypothetical protein LBI60_04075 [Bacteroidales bacterium]|nr:hypothetical protein [Bacteroidales bacterium]
MLSNARKLVHLGMDYMIRRSTLSDANERRKVRDFVANFLQIPAARDGCPCFWLMLDHYRPP